MTTNQRMKAFISLGNFLNQFSDANQQSNNHPQNEQFYSLFQELIKTVHIYNGWFTEANVRNAISALTSDLSEESLVDWASKYIHLLNKQKEAKNVAVIMAGNIPMVGFHDMLCVLISGHKFIGKLSSDDKLLLPFISKVLIAIEPEFALFIEFTEGQIKNCDAVIATGSNNSARYFEYYFGKYPNIIRKNRNSAAVLTGLETPTELALLGKDVFQYFGLGCRNVSKLFVPSGYTFDAFYEAIYPFNEVINNNKYGNNYEYNRTVYLMSNQNNTLLDNNFLLLKEDTNYSSPIGVLFFEYYSYIKELNNKLEKDRELVQCVVSSSAEITNAISFGQTQCPTLNDYADGIDTMQFLGNLN